MKPRWRSGAKYVGLGLLMFCLSLWFWSFVPVPSKETNMLWLFIGFCSCLTFTMTSIYLTLFGLFAKMRLHAEFVNWLEKD